MSRECSVCAHIHRRSIETAMIQDQPSRRIAADYGLNYQAVVRHRNNHLPAAIRAAAAEAVHSAHGAETTADATIAPAPACEAVEAVPVAPASTVRRRTRALQLTDSPPAPPVAPAPTGHAAPAATSTAPPAGTFNLYQSATDLRERAMAILAAAERDRDAKTALMAIREARGVLDHMSRLEERQGGNAVAVPLVDSPEWHRTRAAIISALADHPEARLAVAEALIATGALN